MMGALIGGPLAALLLICGGVAVALAVKNSGRPRMTRFERKAVDRRVSNHLQQLAEEAAAQKVVEAMGYELREA